MKKIVILISGRGSNMQSIVKAARAERWPAEIAAVISNRPEAEGLEFARRHAIPTAVLDNKAFATRETFDQALQELVDRFAPDLVVLAGFMRILSPGFVNHYAGRLINIHPSLLPEFKGLHTHQRALQAGVKQHGASVHIVTAELDHGPILDQIAVAVHPDDTEDSLAARVLEQEHVLYPRVIRNIVEGNLALPT